MFHRAAGENDANGPAVGLALCQSSGLEPSKHLVMVGNDSDYLLAPGLSNLYLVQGLSHAGHLVDVEGFWRGCGVEQRHGALLAGLCGCDYCPGVPGKVGLADSLHRCSQAWGRVCGA